MHEDGFVRKALPNRLCKVLAFKLTQKELFMFCRMLLLITFTVNIAGCASSRTSNGVGEWIPMTDDYEEVDFGKEYGMLKASYIFEGLAFWEDSPVYLKPPYSFHWYGNKIRVWSPYEIQNKTFNVARFDVDVDKCHGLSFALNSLKEEIKNSVSKMVDDGPEVHRKTIVLSPTFYKIKVFPPNMLGSITLNSIEWDRVSWVKEAKNVKSIAEGCRESQQEV